MNTNLPFQKQQIEQIIAAGHPTPFHLYDEARLRAVCKTLKSTMDAAGVPGFKNYFAVKALPNPSILRVLANGGMGMDCSSEAELALAEMAGLSGRDIMFTSNNTTDADFAYAMRLGAIINFDDISFVQPFVQKFGAPTVACLRYNPGDIEFGGVNEAIIGSPREAKYGMPLMDMIAAYRTLKQAGVEHFGIHTMLLSNELDWRNHEQITSALFDAANAIAKQVGITFEFINLGGGIGVPYRPAEHEFDIQGFATALAALYRKYNLDSIGSPAVVMENGRYITADCGYLITQVINQKHTHKTYIGVDATMSDLMRPGMYGAYHHITVLGKQDEPPGEQVDIVGSLCENNDKFAVDRVLPVIETGDLLAIHTTGAHGHAMGFQYNGKLRHAELLLHPNKTVTQIRRAESLQDYFATLTEQGVYHVPTN